MPSLNKMMMYPLKKRKRLLISGICCVLLVYGFVELLYLHDNYSPLQLLSSVESEASRLLKFIGQTQVQCNTSLMTNNASTWMICQEPDVGVTSLASDDKESIVYSIGPSPDYSFEIFVSRNLTFHLFIFSHLADKLKPLAKASPETVNLIKTTIVPNDPADFARNSFDTQTLNSVMTALKHKEIAILKLDTFLDTVHSHEVLRFLINDGLLQNVKEIHIVLKLDKVEEDYIYSWYRVLYALFHTAKFRLYHTATSDPLCLQDTVMESCKYYLSWIRQPPPHIFVLYPPAIDGTYDYEAERMMTYLESSLPQDGHLLPVKFQFFPMARNTGSGHLPSSKTLFLELSQDVIKKNSHSCSIIFIFDKNHQHLSHQQSGPNKGTDGCEQHLFVFPSTTSSLHNSIVFLPLSPSSSDDRARLGDSSLVAQIRHILTSSHTNIIYIELENAFDVLSLFSSVELLKFIDQLIIKSTVFSTSGKPQPIVLRKIYSELMRLQEFQMTLVGSDKLSTENLKYEAGQDVYTLNFVKSSLL